MISAKALQYKNRNTKALLAIHPEEYPVSLQLFGSDPDIVSEMAKGIEEGINTNLKAGILMVNQRVDWLQEQMNILEQLVFASCITHMAGMCVTSVQYQNFSRAANLSRAIGAMLLGNWSHDLDTKMKEL